ncbi:MAG: hypothetical protein OHK0044_16380 [Burkholderiaceae bacterium]
MELRDPVEQLFKTIAGEHLLVVEGEPIGAQRIAEVRRVDLEGVVAVAVLPSRPVEHRQRGARRERLADAVFLRLLARAERQLAQRLPCAGECRRNADDHEHVLDDLDPVPTHRSASARRRAPMLRG